jgi:hypothetical protein
MAVAAETPVLALASRDSSAPPLTRKPPEAPRVDRAPGTLVPPVTPLITTI